MLEAAAEEAELTGRIRAFLAWVGPGRKLTATGRIGLADARHLVELLGTGDTIDPDIGGRVFKTRSSEDLPHLSRIVAWAKAARLVRVSGTKLVPVKKNAALAERPLDLVLALLEAYPRARQAAVPAEYLASVPRRRRIHRHQPGTHHRTAPQRRALPAG